MKPIRIGIVAVNVRSASSGSNEVYLRGLLGGLRNLDLSDIELHIYCADPRLVQDALGESRVKLAIHETRLPKGKVQAYCVRVLHETRIALSRADDVLLFATTSIGLVARQPQVVFVHWDTKLQPDSAPPLQARFNSFMLRQIRRSDAFALVPTAAYGRHLRDKWGLSEDRICPISHGVSIHDSPAETKNPGYVVSVINDLPHKNLPVLMSAWEKVAGRVPEARLSLVGRIGDAALDATGVQWRAMVSRGSLVRTQWLNHDDVMQAIASSALLISPSEGETFCLPLAEAMALGTPVIAADTDVAREVCGEAAAFYPVNDASALADEVVALLGNPDRANEMTAGGLERAHQFRWDSTAQRTIDLLKAVAMKANPATYGRKEPMNWHA